MLLYPLYTFICFQCIICHPKKKKKTVGLVLTGFTLRKPVKSQQKKIATVTDLVPDLAEDDLEPPGQTVRVKPTPLKQMKPPHPLPPPLASLQAPNKEKKVEALQFVRRYGH